MAIRISQIKLAAPRQVSVAVAKRTYEKQRALVEDRIEAALAPFFEDQIKSAAKRLAQLGVEKRFEVIGQKVFCSTGIGGGVDPTCSSGGGKSLPAPPKIAGKAGATVGAKMEKMFAAASAGDTAALHKIKTNPDAQSPYPKKLHEYKMSLLDSMKRGETPAGGGSKTELAKVDTSKLLGASKESKQAAAAGDFDAMGKIAQAEPTQIAPLKQALEQVNPPPTKTETLANTEAGVKEKLQNAKPKKVDPKDFQIVPLADNGVDKEALRKKYEDHAKEDADLISRHKDAYSEQSKLWRIEGQADAYAAAKLKSLRTRQELDARKTERLILRATADAADPVAFEKSFRAYNQKKLDIDEEGIQLLESLHADGVRPGFGYSLHNSFEIHSIASKADVLPVESVAKEYPGLTQTHYDKLKAYKEKRSVVLVGREKDPDSARARAAYYGEPTEVRKLDSSSPQEVSYLLPKKVESGGAEPEVKAFFDQAHVAMQTKPAAIDKLAKSGRLKNGFHGGASGVGKGKSGYYDSRRKGEESLFGISQTSKVADDRPYYGYLEHPDRSLSTGSDIGSNYGEAQIVFKADVKSRTAYTYGDSLDDRYRYGTVAGAVSNPISIKKSITNKDAVPTLEGNTSKDFNVARKSDGWKNRVNYVEAQIFGGTTLDDIAEIRVPQGTALSPKAIKNLTKAGVVVRHTRPPLRDYARGYEDTWDYDPNAD